MKCLLIPVDYSTTTANTLQYIADLSIDYQIEEIILLKVFYLSEVAQLFPSPDMMQLGIAEIALIKEQEKSKLHDLKTAFSKKINKNITVNAVSVTDELLPSIAYLLANKEPDLIVLGNPLDSCDNEISLREFIVPIAKMSNVPVLLIPDQIKYQSFERALLPTSFQNLEKLQSFKKLVKSQAWLKAEIMVLNVDSTHRHDEIETDDDEIIGKFLDGFQFQINYTYATDIAGEILRYAQQEKVQFILALPGKHGFFYNLTHKSVTKSFALESHFPILLLK